MRKSSTIVVFGLFVLMAACSNDAGGVATTDAAATTATTTGTSTTTLPVTTVAPTTTTTTTTTTPLSVVQPAATRAGLGDSYYPDLGNGGYDAVHYTLDLTVDVENNALEAKAIMEARAFTDLTSFNLDFIGYEITALTVNGDAAEYDRQGAELTVLPQTAPEAGDEFTVEVGYRGKPRAHRSQSLSMFSMGWLWTPDQVTVVAEPDAARTWYPVNDHPLDKATYTIRVTVPAPYVVAANGLAAPVTTSGDMLTYLFEPRDPMASYLVTINIGRFDVITEEGPAGLPLRSYVPPDLGLPAGFARTADMIAYYSEVFGPYPFETYGVVIVDGFEAALENQTLSVFGRYLATFPDAEIVAAHELAHQWFGDSVTPARWEDIWLNEGFATYAEWLWLEHIAGPAVAEAQIRGAYGEMRRGGWAPPGDPAPDNLFDGSVYLGGGLVLNALRSEIGDTDFFATLRTYVDRYSYSNATTDDFISVAEEVSGRQLDDLFDLWLHSPTIPDLPA